MQQQKAASTVSQRLPAIVEDCCKITDLIQFKLRLHEQLIWGDKGSELRNCPSFSCQGDNQITGESMYLQTARWRCTLISNGGYYTSRFSFFFLLSNWLPFLVLQPSMHWRIMKLLELLEIEPHFFVGWKVQNSYFSNTPWRSAGQQDSTLSHSASGTKVTVGILRMRRKPLYRLLISVHVNNLKSKDYENSESVNFLSD